MRTVHTQKRNDFDLVIVVDNIGTIKVWSEQIECAMAGLKPHYHVARSGISHLDRKRLILSQQRSCWFCLTQHTEHSTHR